MKNTSSIVAAFIGGAVVGGALALLLAPESGKDTRQKIADFLEKNGLNLNEPCTKVEEPLVENDPKTTTN